MKMKREHTIRIAGGLLCSLSLVALSGEYRVGPIAFTNENPFDYPQFSPATGYLHAITFEVTNCVRSLDIICDNDSTNGVSLSTSFSEPLHLVQYPKFWPGGSYGIIASIHTNLAGVFPGTDDGDRFSPSTHDGGSDELIYSCSFSNPAGHLIKTDAQVLSGHTGYQSNSASVLTPLFGYALSGPDDFELFRANKTLVGQFYIYYQYETTPLRPEIAGVSLSNSEIRVEIQNISLGSSNTLQRSFDLLSPDWTDAGVFLGNGWKTNWNETIRSGWTSLFYRVLSK